MPKSTENHVISRHRNAKLCQIYATKFNAKLCKFSAKFNGKRVMYILVSTKNYARGMLNSSQKSVRCTLNSTQN